MKMLDLLDIVAGGNGIGHRRERGIDPTTGMEDPVFLPEHRHGNGRYQPAVWYKLIDGVFIPDGAAGPVVLDLAGHRFGGFPGKSGETFGSIWSRAATVKPSNLAWDADKHWVYAMGLGTQYMPDSRGLLHMCPNVGITFNLQAMRQMYPNVRPVRFRAVAGVASELGLADIWVFVDGQLRMKRTQIRMKDGPITVDVEIGPDERFLTLVTTDGGDGIKSDWVVFGDPMLEMCEYEIQSKDQGLGALKQTRRRIKRHTAGIRCQRKNPTCENQGNHHAGCSGNPRLSFVFLARLAGRK